MVGQFSHTGLRHETTYILGGFPINSPTNQNLDSRSIKRCDVVSATTWSDGLTFTFKAYLDGCVDCIIPDGQEREELKISREEKIVVEAQAIQEMLLVCSVILMLLWFHLLLCVIVSFFSVFYICQKGRSFMRYLLNFYAC